MLASLRLNWLKLVAVSAFAGWEIVGQTVEEAVDWSRQRIERHLGTVPEYIYIGRKHLHLYTTAVEDHLQSLNYSNSRPSHNPTASRYPPSTVSRLPDTAVSCFPQSSSLVCIVSLRYVVAVFINIRIEGLNTNPVSKTKGRFPSSHLRFGKSLQFAVKRYGSTRWNLSGYLVNVEF